MKDVPAIIQPLKITLFLTLISSTVWGASGTLQTVNEVSGTGHVSGFYNKADSEFGNGGLQITFSGLTSSAFHSVIFSKDGGPTTAIAEKFYFESGLVTNGIISTGSGETTATIEIRHSQLTAAPYSMSDGNTIRIGLDDNGTSTTPDFWCTITGGGNDLTYDITPPSVTSISDAYIQSGQTTTLSGSGFTDNGNATAVKAGSNSLSFSVDSDASITITGGTGDYTGSVTVTDAAGNTSTAGSVTYTLDNTAPVVSSVDEEAIKQNGTAVITGTGFLTSPASPIASITIGGSTPAGLSFNTDSDTKITITAGSGEASYSSIKVKDEADNESTATTIKIAIDNTAPTISSVSPPIAKDGTTVTISGSGFTNTGISTDPTVSIGGSDLGSLTGYSIISVTNTEIQFTVGTTEVSNGSVVVTDVAGNASGGATKLTVDNTKPTVTAVATRYIRSGQTSVVSGTGFQDDGGDAASVKVGGSTPAGMSFSVDSPTQITITAGSGEVTDGNVVVVDAAGNESTDLNKLLTIDNTAPTVSSLGSSDPDIIKEGSTITVTGTGFNSGSPVTDGTGSASITVGGSTPTGLSWAVNSNTQITITAGSGEASGNVVVTDAAGNSSIETGKTLTIDNTAPVINSITPETSSQTVLKKGDTATLSGSGFTNVGIAGSDATVKLGDTDFTTYGTVSVDNDGQITLTVDPNSTANVQGNLKVTDFAGNVTTFSSNTFYIDNTAPTITSVSPPAIKNGSTSTITGTGFKTGTLESTLLVGGTTPTGMTYTVDSGTQITITAGTGETSDQQIVITDPAGNASTDDKRLTIDNSAPSVTTVGTASIKDGSTSVITGSGFFTTVDGTTDGTGVTVTVGGSTPAGMTHVVSSNTQITITAGSGEVTEGNVVVTDRAGNSSTETGKLLTIDNTAPVITSVSPSAIKSGATATVSGTGFKVGGIPSSVKVGGSVPTGMDTSSITNTSLVITAGSGEVTNGQIVITDAAGNASTSAVFLTIDNTPPDVTTVSPSVVKSGDDFTITGSGFTVGGDASAVEVGGGVPTGLSFSVDSDTKITGTAGSGEVTGGNVTVTDAAGNESTDTGKLLTIDNTAPTLSSISDRWIKNGESTTLTGSGFATNGNATQVTVGGSTPTGLTFAVNSDTKITITGGTGEVTRGTVVVYDTVGNPSTETNVKLSVDNTAPAAPTLSLNSWYDKGFFNDDEISFSTTPGMIATGTVAGDSVTVLMNGTPVLARRATGSTTFLYWGTDNQSIGGNTSITGGDGTYSFTATSTDSAENVSSASATLSYRLDTTAPTTPIISGIAAASNTGESTTDRITNDNTPAFEITNVTAGNVIIVNYREADDSTFSSVTADKDTIDAVPYTVSLVQGLNDGADHDISVTQKDTAGNTASSSVFSNFTIDTQRPTAALSYSDSLVRFEDNQVVITATFSDGMNSTDVPTISIDLPETTSDISNADMTATANDSVWTYTLSLLDNIDGTAEVTVDGTDNAGNTLLTGSTTGTQLLRIDNTDPSFTSVSPDTGDFINHRRLGWILSEDLFSGTAAFNRVDGPGSSVTVSLAGSELIGGTRSAADLTNPPSLVDGTKYNLVLTGVDSAGNSGSVTIPDVTYDTTGVTVDSLVYSKNPVKPGDTLLISAFFSEIVPSAPSVSIEWPALTTEAVTLDSSVGGSLTQWVGSVEVPTTSGVAKVTPSALDRAGNGIVAILGKTALFDSTLVIDNAAPTCTFVYENLTQTQLEDRGKGSDVVRVTASFSERVDPSPAPTLSVEYGDSTDDSFEGLAAQSSTDDDSTWIFQFTLPDSSKNDGKMALTVSAADLAGNLVSTLTDSQKFEVDNTPPAAFATKGVTPMGSNVVAEWINGLTDSVEVIIPVSLPTVDPTLFGGGEVDIQMFNLSRGTEWVTVGAADSITTSGNSLPFFRSIGEIETALPPNTALLQGDSLAIRAVITDRVGNKTSGSASEDTLVYDPNRPVASAFVGGVVVTQDTIVSSDTLSAVWTPFAEPTPATASGINRYEWAVEEVGSGVINGFKTWASVGTDTSASAALALEHLKSYRVYVRAFDNAGNISDTLSMAPDSVLRLNSAPIFAAIDSQFVDEDIAFSYQVRATDVDTATLKGDTLHYTILDTGITGATHPVTLNELSGVLTWNTPLQADTGNWNVSLRVADEWGFADTVTFILTVNSVNDPPVVSAMPDIQFKEDVINGDTLSLNQYVTDVDDDTSKIVWTAVVAEDPTVYPSYPLFFFGPGTTPALENAVRKFVLGPGKPVRRLERGEEIRTLSASSGLSVPIDTSGGSSFARFVADSNYYVDGRQVTFVATDPAGASDSTSLSVTITPINDPPRLLAIPDTTVLENDTLVLVLRAIDIDDSTVTLRAIPDSSQIKVTVTDSVATFIPEPLWSRQSNILVVVSDEEFSDSTTFLLDVIHVPRPHLSLALGQNVSFNRYYEFMITDTAEKALDVTLTINPQAVAVPLDTVGQFTWVGSYKFDTTGVVVEYVMHGAARVGDTTVTRSSSLTRALANREWSASSSDGIFRVEGKVGSVPFDRTFMIVDSLLFGPNQKEGGRYRMGHPVARFSRPVMVTILPDSTHPGREQAIYQKSADGIWRELPTVFRNGNLLTWTSKMGYFKLGKKTLVIPEVTALGMNYPNPFNARTRIPVDVGFFGGPRQRISVTVYNLLGQEVTILQNGPMGIGRHELVWDGRDKTAIPVASGVYVVRLATESGLSQARKLILLR